MAYVLTILHITYILHASGLTYTYCTQAMIPGCLPRARTTPRPGHVHLFAQRSTAQIALPAATSGCGARADAHMLAQPKIMRCRRVQRKRPAKTFGPKCGRCAQRASKERRVRERRRAMAAPAAACDGGLEWRVASLSREPSSTRGGARAGMLQGVRVRAQVCTCRRPGAPCQTAELNHAPSTRPQEDVKISPCRYRARHIVGCLQQSMPMSTADALRERVRPSTASPPDKATLHPSF